MTKGKERIVNELNTNCTLVALCLLTTSNLFFDSGKGSQTKEGEEVDRTVFNEHM